MNASVPHLTDCWIISSFSSWLSTFECSGLLLLYGIFAWMVLGTANLLCSLFICENLKKLSNLFGKLSLAAWKESTEHTSFPKTICQVVDVYNRINHASTLGVIHEQTKDGTGMMCAEECSLTSCISETYSLFYFRTLWISESLICPRSIILKTAYSIQANIEFERGNTASILWLLC